MITINPFAELSQTIPATFLQFFVIAMVLLIIIGTGLDMLHKKNVVYFFRNAQKAKKSAKTELSAGKKTAVILKTVASDIATTSELGFGKRRLAHVLGMYGTILFWIASVVLIFKYSDGVAAPSVLALLACATFGLAWSYFQSSGMTGLSYLFLILFILANVVLFGGVYWSKFAHMFYKPGAAIQKNLAEADGSRDNLPPPADAPEQFGLGIKREQPKHY